MLHLPKKADLSRADLSGADLFRLLAAARKAAHEAENIAGYAPSFTGTTGFDRPGRLSRDCMSFGILIFGKKMSAISHQ